jgi:hypothetical protein
MDSGMGRQQPVQLNAHQPWEIWFGESARLGLGDR